jgi:AraC-like DNA-binding protein
MEAFIRCSIIKNIIPVHDHVEYAIKDINQHPTHTIEDVCRQLKVTSRHLRRQFKEKIGIGPKYYLRIKRVNKAIALTRNNPRINLQDIVFQCNFFDQSHMAKEFNLFTGKTPYDYIVKNNRNLEMGIIS